MKVTESGKVKTCATTRRDLRQFLRIVWRQAGRTDAFDSRTALHVRTKQSSTQLIRPRSQPNRRTLSADVKVLKVENMTPSGGAGQVVQVEYWDKK